MQLTPDSLLALSFLSFPIPKTELPVYQKSYCFNPILEGKTVPNYLLSFL